LRKKELFYIVSKADHPYFGVLDTSALKDNPGVIWEREMSLNGSTFDVWLWADSDKPLNVLMLEARAARLADLPALDTIARQQLRQYLEQDRYYIEFHLEELPDIPVIKALAPDGDASTVDIGNFVEAMILSGIRLWLNMPDTSGSIIMDYMIHKENSDEILAVKLMKNGELAAVDWES
jgi:hypothetical protein